MQVIKWSGMKMVRGSVEYEGFLKWLNDFAGFDGRKKFLPLGFQCVHSVGVIIAV